MQISTFLASIGNTATVAGNVGNVFASAQGLYRLSSATQGLLQAGGTRKDSTAARLTSARLLEAIQPLADALHPPAAPPGGSGCRLRTRKGEILGTTSPERTGAEAGPTG